MKKQTAVEWLIQNIVEDQTIKAKSMTEWINIFDQSKTMEKEHIMEAFEDGQYNIDLDGCPLNRNAEQYYNETYGK
jgi:hypothetical protein